MSTGRLLWSGEKIDSRWFDVTACLKPGRNRLEIVHQGPGLMPTLMLVRSAVAGPDDRPGRPVAMRREHEAETPVTVPGAARGVFLYRDVEIPADADRTRRSGCRSRRPAASPW